MNIVGRFEKVSEERFLEDYMKEFPDVGCEDAKKIYEGIKLPVRATSGSAGYDILSTVDFTLEPGDEILIPTGLRVTMKDGYCLMVFPRSGLGFRYRLQMNNTVGIIDSDYYFSDNEGHIFVKLTNDSKEGRSVSLRKGDAFVQGIFVAFGITEDDCADGVRNGGRGSTTQAIFSR